MIPEAWPLGFCLFRRFGLADLFGDRQLYNCQSSTFKLSAMSSGSTQQASASPDQIRAQVRQAFDELRVLSRSEESLEEFCRAMLQRVVPLTGAHGCLVWQFDPSVGFKLFQSQGERAGEIPEGHESHRDLLLEVARGGQPMAMDSSALSLVSSVDQSPVPAMQLLVVPVLDRRNRIWGMLELLQRSGINETSRDGYLRFLQQLSSLFSRWHEQHDLRNLGEKEQRWVQRMDLAREVHLARGVKETAYAISNESRRLLDADRVSVASWSGRKSRVEAISSQDKFDNRANVVKMLSRIVDSSIRADEPLWICGNTNNLSPTLAGLVNEFLEESHSRTLGIIPLKSDPTKDQAGLSLDRRPKIRQGKQCGALIVEYFDQELAQSQIAEDLQLATLHATIGMSRSMDEDAVFLMPLWRTLGRLRTLLLGDALKKTIAGSVAVAALVLYLCFWPMTLKMRVDGVLQPEVRRNLFAEIDGVVSAVVFDHNERVAAGEVVLVLDSKQLRLESLQLENQIKTMNEQIDNLDRQLNQLSDLPTTDRFEMAGNLKQFQIQRQGYSDELEIVKKQMESLEIASPIAGTNIMWNARRRLENLPVAANQPLLTIADLDGPWHVELMVPQNRVGYIQRALTDQPTSELETEMILATNPNEKIMGKLVSISDRAEPSDDGTTVFRAIVKLDKKLIERPNPGAGVTVRVACGSRPAGFVWFYQVIDFFRTQVLF